MYPLSSVSDLVRAFHFPIILGNLNVFCRAQFYIIDVQTV